MKKLACLVAAAALLATAGAQAGTKVSLRFAYASNATPTKMAMAKFGELLTAKTNGDVTVTYFPDSQLGGERELVEMAQSGMLDMTKVSGGLLESFAPVYGTFSLPYVFDSQEHFYKVMDDQSIMGPVYNATKDRGIIGLTYYDSGARSFYTHNKPINSVADLKGLKIRVLQSKTLIRTIQLLGASPIAMSQEEVYTGLQQGVLDGAENNVFALTVARHAEVSKYFILDVHTRIPDILLIGTAAMAKLSPDQQKAVKEAAVESTAYQKQLWNEAVSAARKEAADKFGVKISTPDISEFQKAVAPIYDDLKSNPDQYALYQKIRAAADK